MAQPDWIGLYLQEDLDALGDITSQASIPADRQARAAIVVREPCFLAGVAAATRVFERVGVRVEAHMNDGSWVGSGDVIATVAGNARAILAAERTALNILGRMSGIATQTRRLVEALAGACSGAVLAATRKTTPGFRHFEKEAVRIAGADPHRMGLWDEAMIKDNHRAETDVATAVAAIQTRWPGRRITVEVESLDDALAAAAVGAHCLLIDNQDPATGRAWAEAVWAAHPGTQIEVSGGITEATLLDHAWADRISLGALTHHATSIDVGLDWLADGTAPARPEDA